MNWSDLETKGFQGPMKIEPIEQDRSANIEVLGKTGATVDSRPRTYRPWWDF